jgi:hydroxyacylglutathione hydrolase
MHNIFPIAAFSDNYIWAYVHEQQCFVVDPGDANAVFDFLRHKQLTLVAIVITHWHHDHTGGIDALLAQHKVPVYGPQTAKIPQVSHPLQDSDRLQLLDIDFTIYEIPGHTLDHLSYYSAQKSLVFCGDTLFAGGCGRIFEGTPAQMYTSLQRLAQLPSSTLVYCTHEYTLANLRFAIEVEPHNTFLQQRLINCEQQRQADICTLPTSIAIELASNPFLRVNEEDVITQALNQGASSSDAVAVFTCLREWKNNF